MYLVVYKVTVFSIFYGSRIHIAIKYTLITPHLITLNTLHNNILQKVENNVLVFS